MKGQALIETLIGITLMTFLSIGAIGLLISCFAKVILLRWAEENSRCIAQIEDPMKCRWLCKYAIENHFHFKKINISEFITHGIIHTHIEGRLLDSLNIKASYDLGPSEYKRVKQ